MLADDTPDPRLGRPPIVLYPRVAASWCLQLLEVEPPKLRGGWPPRCGRSKTMASLLPTEVGGLEKWLRAGWGNPPALSFCLRQETRQETPEGVDALPQVHPHHPRQRQILRLLRAEAVSDGPSRLVLAVVLRLGPSPACGHGSPVRRTAGPRRPGRPRAVKLGFRP